MSSSPDQATCPVDHETRAAWLAQHRSAPHPPNPEPAPAPQVPSLPTDRETSSIPRTDSSEKWVYPSQSQFYSAMARKHAAGSGASAPNAVDMPVVVPIHNAVNERAWGEVLKWEEGRGGDKCGGVKLHSFQGKPKERTWKAWGRTLLGYQPPFDRHDWIVDRCGHRIRYIIDFYTGKAPEGAPPIPHPMQGEVPKNTAVSFYLDVRPAPASWEGINMRVQRAFTELWTS